MRIRCTGEYHTLKFFFENDASRTSFFLYSFLWPEFAPATFDACKRHESIYLALVFFLGKNIMYLRISIHILLKSSECEHCSPVSRIVFHLYTRQKIDSFKRRILFLSSTRVSAKNHVSLGYIKISIHETIAISTKRGKYIWNIFETIIDRKRASIIYKTTVYITNNSQRRVG